MAASLGKFSVFFHHLAYALRQRTTGFSRPRPIAQVCDSAHFFSLSRRRFVAFNRRPRLLRRQAGMLDHAAKRGPVFDLACGRATQGLRGLARLLHQACGEFDGTKLLGGLMTNLLCVAYCANFASSCNERCISSQQTRRVPNPGMVLTVEPGLYVRPAKGVPKEFWNIGIRIEDDALVTARGCELMTRGVPVAADEIEALMRG